MKLVCCCLSQVINNLFHLITTLRCSNIDQDSQPNTHTHAQPTQRTHTHTQPTQSTHTHTHPTQHTHTHTQPTQRTHTHTPNPPNAPTHTPNQGKEERRGKEEER